MVPELAASLGVEAKTMRAWMRRQDWRHPVEKGSPWVLTPGQVEVLTARFGQTGSAEPAPPDDPEDRPLADRTAGDLLALYGGVLRELRHRGLIRTNNAPIGDLAEYCAAVVYDGLLAPNSEKSYDLTSADGLRVQVKVRVLRAGTNAAAVFSPFRSFDFDLCAFLIVDDLENRVIVAREWTVEQVRELSRHRTHTNGSVVRMSQIRRHDTIGRDRQEDFDHAWQEIMTQPTA